MRARSFCALVLAAEAITAGCGYRLGYPGRAGVRTVAVPIAENQTLRREVEFPLTEAIVREIQRRTPLIVVGSPEAADAVLEVTLSRFEERVLVEGESDEVLESAAILTARVRLLGRDGRPLLEERIVESAEFPAVAGGAAGDVAPQALERIAERVVMLLEEPVPARPAGPK